MIRKKVLPNIEAEVMFKSDRLCCMCKDQQGDQIHHINGDASNGKFENLAFLCFKHHSEASVIGGTRKKLSAKTIIKYRDNLYTLVKKKRDNELRDLNRPIKHLSEQSLFEIT